FLEQRTLERRVPERDRIEEDLDAAAMALRRLHRAMSAGGEPEFLQWLQVELEDDGLGSAQETHLLRPFQVGFVGVLVELLLGRKLVVIEAAVGNVLFKLLGVRGALPVALA